MFLIINSFVTRSEIIQNEISNIQYFNILNDRDYQLLFYSSFLGITIYSTKFDNIGTTYDSTIKEEILYFDLDLINKYIILGNNDFISIYFYGNIFKEGLIFLF